MASLARPLDNYPPLESPAISFNVLPATDAAAQWPSNHPNGTVIMMDLVQSLNQRDARKTLSEASAYLRESVTFQGKRRNVQRAKLSSLRTAQGRPGV